jgi:hypothetical protein
MGEFSILPASAVVCSKDLGMAQIDMAPPPAPPRIAVDDDDGSRRIRLRLSQLWMTLVTVLVTAWVMTLGQPILTIVAVVTAKHVLVAILVMGLGADAAQKAES